MTERSQLALLVMKCSLNRPKQPRSPLHVYGRKRTHYIPLLHIYSISITDMIRVKKEILHINVTQFFLLIINYHIYARFFFRFVLASLRYYDLWHCVIFSSDLCVFKILIWNLKTRKKYTWHVAINNLWKSIIFDRNADFFFFSYTYFFVVLICMSPYFSFLCKNMVHR